VDWIKQILLLFIGGLVSASVALYLYNKKQQNEKEKDIAQDHERLERRVVELEKALALVSQTVLPISTVYQAMLVRELTHAHTPVVDALLAKVGIPGALSEQDMLELQKALERRYSEVDPQIGDDERDAARIFPIIMKRAKVEQMVIGAGPLKIKFATVAAIPLEVK
jgi:hypothetical protein